ncbi:ElyC/SanA/YdcF family protein [Hutsoniella sourekii]
MKLKEASLRPTVENANDSTQTKKFYTQYVGEYYLHHPAFTKVINRIKIRNMNQAIDLLDLMIAEGKEVTSAYRLKGEIYSFYGHYLAAWEQFDQILKINRRDKQALFLSTFFAKVCLDDDAVRERLRYVKMISPQLAQLIIDTYNFIERNNQRTDFESQIPDDTRFDCLIIYGHRLKNNGDFTDILKKRLQKSLEYAKIHPQADIIIAGGPVHNSYHEALAINKWLIEQGVDSKKIILDLTTLSLVACTNGIVDSLKQSDYRKICIISTIQHLPRMWLSLKSRIDYLKMPIEVYGVSYEEEHPITIPAVEISKSYDSVIRSMDLFNLDSDYIH